MDSHLLRYALLSLVVATTTPQAGATRLFHVISESDTIDSRQSLGGCHSLAEHSNISRCLPSIFATVPTGEIGIRLMVDANEPAAQTLSKLATKSADEATLDKLFREQSFSSVSGIVQARAIFRSTLISFTPQHVLGAYKISNPTLPELHVSFLRQKEFRLAQNMIFNSKEIGYDWHVAPGLYYFDREFTYGDFDVLELPGRKSTELLRKEKQKDFDLDLGVAALSRMSFAPSLALRLEHLRTQYRCQQCEQTLIEIDYLYQPTLTSTLSAYVDHPLGKSVIGAVFKQVLADSLDLENFSSFYTYQLSRLTAHIAYSPTAYAFGFVFRGQAYRVGVQYTDEKQDNSLEIERRKKTYLSAEFYL